MRRCGSTKPSSVRPRESVHWILDVINLELEPVREGEVDEGEVDVKKVGVLCKS